MGGCTPSRREVTRVGGDTRLQFADASSPSRRDEARWRLRPRSVPAVGDRVAEDGRVSRPQSSVQPDVVGVGEQGGEVPAAENPIIDAPAIGRQRVVLPAVRQGLPGVLKGQPAPLAGGVAQHGGVQAETVQPLRTGVPCGRDGRSRRPAAHQEGRGDT
jgi:hypothetical protein